MSVSGDNKYKNIARLNQLKRASLQDRVFGISVAEGEFQGITQGQITGKTTSTTAGHVIQDEGGPIVIQTVASKIEAISTAVNDTILGSKAKKIKIYGVDINWNPIGEEIEMAGLSASTPTVQEFLYVINAVVIGSGAIRNEGDITIRKETAGATMAKIIAAKGATRKAVFPVFAGCTLYLTEFYVGATRAGLLTGQINLMAYELDQGIRVSYPVVFKDGEPADIHWEAGVKEYSEKTLLWVEIVEVSENSTLTTALAGTVVRHSDTTP